MYEMNMGQERTLPAVSSITIMMIPMDEVA
jgi:hypothetical protein